MKIDTNKMRGCGKEIRRLSGVINNNVITFYNILANIPNEAWVGPAAERYVNGMSTTKKSALDLVNDLNSESNMIINYASRIDTKINGLKR